MSTVTICDVCGKEINSYVKYEIRVGANSYFLDFRARYYDLCHECATKLHLFLTKKGDFIKKEEL